MDNPKYLNFNLIKILKSLYQASLYKIFHIELQFYI